MKDSLFFDLDGTLSDTHDLSRATWLEVLRPHGIDVDFDFYRQHIRGFDNHEVIEALLPDLDVDEKRRLREAERHSYMGRVRRARPLPGVSDFLQYARRRGYNIALATNAPKASAKDSLEPLGLIDVFDPMSFAEEVGAPKPDPAVYNLALERVGVAPAHGIAFEDSVTGVTAAHAAGLAVVGLVTTHHPTDLRDAGAALVVGDFADPVLYRMLEDPSLLEQRE